MLKSLTHNVLGKCLQLKPRSEPRQHAVCVVILESTHGVDMTPACKLCSMTTLQTLRWDANMSSVSSLKATIESRSIYTNRPQSYESGESIRSRSDHAVLAQPLRNNQLGWQENFLLGQMCSSGDYDWNSLSVPEEVMISALRNREAAHQRLAESELLGPVEVDSSGSVGSSSSTVAVNSSTSVAPSVSSRRLSMPAASSLPPSRPLLSQPQEREHLGVPAGRRMVWQQPMNSLADQMPAMITIMLDANDQPSTSLRQSASVSFHDAAYTALHRPIN